MKVDSSLIQHSVTSFPLSTALISSLPPFPARSTLPQFPIRKKRVSRRQQPNMTIQNPIRQGKSSYSEAGWSNPIEGNVFASKLWSFGWEWPPEGSCIWICAPQLMKPFLDRFEGVPCRRWCFTMGRVWGL